MQLISIFILTILFSGGNLCASESLDEFLQNYDGRLPQNMGPNCFATASSAANIVPYSGYMDGKQFQNIMESSLCSPVAESEALTKGDVLLVFNEEFDEKIQLKTRTPVHAAIYLNKNEVFEKASFASSTTPMVTPLEVALGPYSKEPLDILRQERQLEGKSQAFVKAYKCSNFLEYVKAHHSKWHKQFEREIGRIILIENEVRDWTQSPRVHYDKLRAMTSRLAQRLRSLNFALSQRFIVNDRLPHKRSMGEQIWYEAPVEIAQIYQMRFSDLIHQLQLLLARNIREDFPASSKLVE